MKKLITSIAIVFIIIASNAQTQSSTHLLFKGIPIDGTLNDYVSKMKQNGFTLLQMEDGMAMLKGDFAAYKNCMIGVVTLKQKDLVSKISVIFPECETWSDLSSNYFSLKKMLSEKYGNPTDNYEKFENNPSDDNSKMFEVKMNSCKYYTIYETDKGSIQLSIESSEMICYVSLSYFDKINGEIIRANAIDDL